jgi:hypothetical protein
MIWVLCKLAWVEQAVVLACCCRCCLTLQGSSFVIRVAEVQDVYHRIAFLAAVLLERAYHCMFAHKICMCGIGLGCSIAQVLVMPCRWLYMHVCRYAYAQHCRCVVF